MDKKTTKPTIEAKDHKKRIKRTYFLYVPEHGFIGTEEDGKPTFAAKPMAFAERKMAAYAAGFFKTMKFAEDIKLCMVI